MGMTLVGYLPVVCTVNIHCSTNPDCNIHGRYCMHVFTKQGVGLCYYSEQMHTNFIGCKSLLTACSYGKL